MDFEKMLRAYMKTVWDCEGATFVRPPMGGTAIETDLTPEELEWLRQRGDEIRNA